MSKRRILLRAFAATLAGNSMLVWAQSAPAGVRRVGVLAPSTRAKEDITLKPFFDGMRELGWIEGRNVSFDRVYADDDHARLPALAAELVARKPDAIYAPPTVAALAAKNATRTIPIIFGSARAVVDSGLVASLARPGGNLTGVTTIGSELGPKRLQLLHELLPNVRRVGILFDKSEFSSRQEKQSVEGAHAKLGLDVVFASVSSAREIEAAVKELGGGGVQVLFVTASTVLHNYRKRLIALCKERKLPVFGYLSEWVADGALASYGTSLNEQLRRSAYLMDKVLKGAKPADIPVEQPTKFELVINLKTAKALGLKLPDEMLLRADRVIE